MDVKRGRDDDEEEHEEQNESAWNKVRKVVIDMYKSMFETEKKEIHLTRELMLFKQVLEQVLIPRRDLGLLSIVTLRKVHPIFREGKKFELGPDFWKVYFEVELLPTIGRCWAHHYVEDTDPRYIQEFIEEFKTYRRKEVAQYQANEGVFFHHPGYQPNDFYFVLAMTVLYCVAFPRTVPGNPNDLCMNQGIMIRKGNIGIALLLWRGQICNQMILMGDEGFRPKFLSFWPVSFDKDGEIKVLWSYFSWPQEIIDLFEFSAFGLLAFKNFIFNPGDAVNGFVLPGELRRPALSFLYWALQKGWMFDEKTKSELPANMFSCLTCATTNQSIKYCGGCLDNPTPYCSVECQRKDWVNHRAHCKGKK